MMMEKKFDKLFWEEKYESNESKWNVRKITPPIKDYVDQLSDKTLSILIPGVGHGHELYYLHKNGFNNIKGLDFTDIAVNESKQSAPDFPIEKLILEDFFEHEGQYDLIIEQTFFCSLPVYSRKHYIDKMFNLLKPGGKLVGVLFDWQFNSDIPPFGGSKDEYLSLFADNRFEVSILETAYNSIKPRAGRELFFIIIKQHD